MGIARLIRRAAPLIVVGLAGAAAARRRAERLRQAQPTPAPDSPPVAQPEPVVEPEPEPEPETPADEQPTDEQTALAPWLEPADEEEGEQPAPEEPAPAEAASVTEIVDDLLAPGEDGERIEDATVVEGSVEEGDEPPDDEALAEAVRTVLAEQPGLLPGTVEVEVEQGAVRLSGEVESVEAITELERRAGDVPGIHSVRSFLHVPGTPPPAAGEHR